MPQLNMPFNLGIAISGQSTFILGGLDQLLLPKMFTISPSLVCAPKLVQKMNLYSSNLSYNISQVQRPSFHCNGSMRTSSRGVACHANDSGVPGEEHRALETVLKLYEAIKNKNVNELSDIIAEECSCVSNFVSAFQPFLGKKQVLAFFSCLMKNLGNDIKFVVQQTSKDGMVVSVSWNLEWNEVPLALGKGFSIYICHAYHGKVMIKNVEIFLEPILHIEPPRLKMISHLMTAMEKLNPKAMFKNKKRAGIILFFILLFLYLLKYKIQT